MAHPRASFVCNTCLRSLQRQTTILSARAFSTSAIRPSEIVPDLPRWRQTPPAMKMPYRVRPLPKQPLWKVNDRQDLLDEMYDKLLGRIGDMAKGQLGVTGTRGRDMLPDEIKWLAVTHKSFDHGRQGFNDRLAFLGKRLVDLQTSIALVQAPAPPSSVPGEQNVFSHPSLEGVDNISSFNKAQILAPARVAQVARSFGVEKVVRWKPKKSDNLQGSGVDTVLAHTMYSIIGALALQRGGELAVRTVRERILKPLGLR